MIGTAVVGLGWWGRTIAEQLQDADANFEVRATVDPEPAAGASYRDLDAALERADIEAVILCTPNSLHADQVVRCAEHGKHVFAEKPLALTMDDARRAVHACRSAEVVLGVGHERRFEPAFIAVRERCERGELGTILHAEAQLSHDRFRTLDPRNWRGSPIDAPAAGMTAMGVHLTDLLISLLGPVFEVHAYVETRALPLQNGDVVSISLRFRDRTTAVVAAVSATPTYGRVAIFGDEAWVEVWDLDHPEAGSPSQLTMRRRDGNLVSENFPPSRSVLANLAAFGGAVRGETKYPVTDAELVHNVAVLEAIVESAASGDIVQLDEEPWFTAPP